MVSSSSRVASVDVTGSQQAVLQPLGTGDVRITGGFWAGRQHVNRAVILVEAAQHLEGAGNFENFRLAAGAASGPYRLPSEERLPFLDSDVYKWLEAVGWELGREPSPQLTELADDAIALVGAAQEEDGYLNTYYRVVEPGIRWDDLAWGHELYCAGHLIQAAIAHARGRGDEALLRIARRLADRIDADFGHDRRHGVGGHPEIEMALVELYRLTGTQRYLDRAAYFVDERGRGLAGHSRFGSSYFQDHEPVREAKTVTGHAVRQLYLSAGATDLYLETGDQQLLEALVHQWESMVAAKTYLTGGVGSRHQDEAFGDPYELPPDRAYNETCAAIASVMWAWRLLLATGDARYAELIERTLFNGFAAGLSLDGQRFFYVNRLHARVDPALSQDRSGVWATLQRRPWFGCACCPPNVMRLLSSLEHYVATQTETGVQLHQFTTGTLAADLGGGQVELAVTTDYPWDGKVRLRVTATIDREWELALRVPAWCGDARLTVNGHDVYTTPSQGYLRVMRAWRAGDEIVLNLQLLPRIIEPHPYIDAVRGCLAVQRGPLVYCLEGIDLPDVDFEDVRLAPRASLEARDEPDLLGGVVTVIADAVARRSQNWSGLPYRPASELDEPTAAASSGASLKVRMIPYYAWASREAGPMRVWVPRI